MDYNPANLVSAKPLHARPEPHASHSNIILVNNGNFDRYELNSSVKDHRSKRKSLRKNNENSSMHVSHKNLSPTNAIMNTRNSQEMNADIGFLIDPFGSNQNLLKKVSSTG